MEGELVPRHVYQDLVLDGKTVVTGRRDCLGRWSILEPYLPHAGSILDVGSNLGWFGLKICERFPRCVVASVEADERSAALQRKTTAESRIMVINVGDKTIGIVVDAVSEVFRVARDQIAPPPPTVAQLGNEYLTGLVKLDKRLLILLDIDHLLAGQADALVAA